MHAYIVRGYNWMVEVEMEFDNFIEAATRAVEQLFLEDIKTFDGKPPRVTSVIQVSREEYDIEVDLSDFDPDACEELSEAGHVQFIYAPVVLANAGKYSLANELQNYIENPDTRMEG